MPNTLEKINIQSLYRFFSWLGEVKKVKFYTFNDKRFAKLRNCRTKLTGWKISYSGFIKLLEDIKATEYYVK